MAEYVDKEKAIYLVEMAVSKADAMMALLRMDPADVAPVRHGKWLEDPDDDWGVRCSECGHLEMYQFDFCAGCGADMRGKQDG